MKSGKARWQNRRHLTFSPLMNVPNKHLYTDQIPLREIQKVVEQHLHIGWLRKYPHQNRLKMLRHLSGTIPTTSTIPYNWERTHNSQLLSEDKVIGLHIQHHNFYGCHLRDWLPSSLIQQGLAFKSPPGPQKIKRHLSYTYIKINSKMN